MKIRAKFSLMVAIPTVAIALILTVGMISFSQIKNNVQQLNSIHDDRATMISARNAW